MKNKLCTSLFLVPLLANVYFVHAGTIPLNINPEDCGELIEAADNHALAVRKTGKDAVDSVTKGTDDLEESSCMGKFDGISFDFFDGVPSMRGAVINGMKEAALKAYEDIKAQGCAFAQNAQASVNKAMTCSAAVGVNVNANVGTDVDTDMGQCFGADSGAFDYQYEGDIGNGGGEYGIGESTEEVKGGGLQFW